jgi:hypothetical protein
MNPLGIHLHGRLDLPSDALGLGDRALVPYVAGVEGAGGLEEQHGNLRLGDRSVLNASGDQR